MTKEELIEKIQACIGENSGIEIYFGLKNGECRKGNFANAVQNRLKSMFVESLNGKILADEIQLLELSSADERKDAIYHYDIQMDEPLEGTKWMYEICNPDNDIQVFSFGNDGLDNIAYLLIKIATIDSQLVIYRNLPPINNYKKQSSFFTIYKNNIFDEMQNNFLKISPGIELLKIDDELVVADLKFFERSFGFHDQIKHAANTQIIRLGAANFLEGIDELSDAAENDINVARKLSNLENNSPVLKKMIDGEIAIDAFINFTKTNPALIDKFKYSEANKISIRSKKHIKYLLKVLNDDYLMSELTRNIYDSLAKDKIELANP